MSLRAVSLGFALGLFIAAYTYFNDHVAHQGQFIASFMPIAVFGVAVLLVLLANPVAGRLGLKPLGAGELAVIAALALSVCGFPGSNFLRYFGSVMSQPAHLEKIRTSWQAENVFSYLPGSVPYLASGQVRDWPGLVDRVADEDDELHALVTLATQIDRGGWQQAFTGQIQPERLTRAINHVLADPAFADVDQDMKPHEVVAASRQRLQDLAGEMITPPPAGEGALVLGGRADPRVTEPMSLGSDDRREGQWLGDVPWSLWRKPIVLWVGTVLLLGLVSMCLALIFHPQWSQRELLPYPVARVITDLGRRSGDGFLPDLARSPMFWIAFLVPFSIHVLNGLHAWHPQVPQMPLRLDFNGLRGMFPNASRSALSGSVFAPLIIPSVVAFTFLLNRSVSFTLGITNIVFVAVGALFIANGMEMEYNKFTPNKNNMLRLGAYLGSACMIAYAGRRYYWHVMLSAVSLKQFSDTPTSATWAARIGAALLFTSVWLLSTSGMSLWLSAVMIGLVLLVCIVLARVLAETGMILQAGPFLPLGVLPALLGPEAIGPTQIILMGIAGFLLVGDPKEAVLPFLMHGLKMGQGTGVKVGRLAWPMIVMIVLGLGVATYFTLSLQYQFGVNHGDNYATNTAPSSGFNEAVKVIGELEARGTLDEAVAMGPWEQIAAIRAEPAALGWFGVGLGLVLICGTLMLRVPRWPIHPVMFIVWGVWGIAMVGFSMLLGWLANMLVVKLAGMKGYRMVQPAVFGIIAGELTAGLLWMVVASISYFATGQAPPSYRIFP